MKLTRGVLKSRGTENVCKEPAHWKDTIAMHITDGGRKDSTPKQLALVNTPVSNTTILLLKPDLKASPPPPPPPTHMALQRFLLFLVLCSQICVPNTGKQQNVWFYNSF